MSAVIKLTNLGRIAHLNTTMTAPEFWTKLVKEIERVQDQDGEWEQLVDERIRGLQQLRAAISEHGTDWLTRLPDSEVPE